MASITYKQTWIVFSVTYWAISLFILTFFNGTGQEADSINHYLFAKYAPSHPELYLDHWAKPMFTLIASPFAQFGFIGVKLFNITCVYFTSLILYRIGLSLKLNQPILSPIFLFLFPISFQVSFSGLTEPFCALILSLAVLLFHEKKFLLAAFLLSLTPFIRSEGLLFIGIFSIFFIFRKNWKALFLLSSGHILYAIIGFYHYQDLFWVFTKIPYAHLSSHYGSGSLFHFAEKLNYLMGIPLLVLFVFGCVRMLSTFKGLSSTIQLVFSLFFTFFIAHTLFWHLEIFNSMGLKRVFAAVTPLMSFIALFGFDLINRIEGAKVQRTLKGIILIVILIFPFTSNPAAVEWEDLNLSNAQENALKVASYIEKEKLDVTRFVYTDPFLSYALNIDPFDTTKYSMLAIQNDEKSQFQFGDLIIWDNWHSVVDCGVSQEYLHHLKLLKTFTIKNSVYALYIYENK